MLELNLNFQRRASYLSCLTNHIFLQVWAGGLKENPTGRVQSDQLLGLDCVEEGDGQPEHHHHRNTKQFN